jgi:hypothetical protein
MMDSLKKILFHSSISQFLIKIGNNPVARVDFGIWFRLQESIPVKRKIKSEGKKGAQRFP